MKTTAAKRALKVRLLEKSGGFCWYCGVPLREDTVNVDHFIPGFSDDFDNLVPACRPCNSGKKDRSIDEFRRAKCHEPFTPRQKVFLANHGIVIPSPNHVFWYEKHGRH